MWAVIVIVAVMIVAFILEGCAATSSLNGKYKMSNRCARGGGYTHYQIGGR
jgi:hypothetical protein